MPDSVPSWLATMREIDGTKWAPGDGPDSTIQSWLRFVGAAYPQMAPYCNSVMSEDYFSWCGLTVGFCMAKAGIAPVFGATDTSRFLYATAWLGWGSAVTVPQPGDVLVFNFGGGDHHVTLFEKDNGNGTWSCHGGNQSHQVTLTNFAKSNLMGIRRPNVAAGAQPGAADTLAPGAMGRTVTALQSALAAKGFDPGGIDGEFGPLTSVAVSNFQRAQNLPVTGIVDPATLNALGLSTDVGPRSNVATVATGEPTMQAQDVLKTVVDALITKTTAAATPIATPAQGQVDMTQLLQVAIAALAGKPVPAQPAAGAATDTTPPVASTIDQIFGGQALTGKKTMLAVIAYVILAILEATKQIDTGGATSNILTTLIGGFGVLGGAAKIDRLTQALGQVANPPTPPQK
jgi:uncharacterized protein (TIGR02594 family)